MTTLLYNPTSTDFRLHRNEIYKRMRDESPVFAGPEGQYFALSRFEDIRNAAVDWSTYSAVTAEARIFKPMINDMDPPRHSALRAVLSRAFTPRRVGGLESRMRDIAAGLIAAFADRGSCELMSEFARVFPSEVMSELLGIPPEVRAWSRELTDKVMRIHDPEDNIESAAEIYALFDGILTERRRAPRDDLLGALLVAEADGQRLTDDEILGFAHLLLIGGNDTTTNLIGNGMELLARHPDQLAEVAGDRSLLPAAIEEMLRVEPPTLVLARQTTRNVDLHGVRIPQGRRVLLVWASGNLDERAFTDPERFDIHRDAERHLSFGYGAHFCMGAALARLEARVAFEELLSALPDFAVGQPAPERIESSWAWGWQELPLVFRPRH